MPKRVIFSIWNGICAPDHLRTPYFTCPAPPAAEIILNHDSASNSEISDPHIDHIAFNFVCARLVTAGRTAGNPELFQSTLNYSTIVENRRCRWWLAFQKHTSVCAWPCAVQFTYKQQHRVCLTVDTVRITNIWNIYFPTVRKHVRSCDRSSVHSLL
jgi:hypothetical protein